MGRTVEHFGARTVANDGIKCLCLIPLFPGESVDSIKLDGYAAALTDEDISNPIHMAWVGVGIPWNILDNMDAIADGTQADFSTVAQYDAAFEQLILSADEGTGEVLGGDVDIDPEVTVEDDLSPAEDPLMIDQPLGVYKFLNKKTIGRPYAAAGNATIRFGDDFWMRIAGDRFRKESKGQLLMLGMARYDMSQTQEDFNIELDDAVSIRAMGLMKSGNLRRMGSLIAANTGATGDFARTVLFGGDLYIEASTIKTVSVKAYLTAEVHISGPWSREMAR